MYNGYPNFNNPYQQYTPAYRMPADQFPQMKCRPVSSIDEVRAAQIDFDGSISVFPDLASKKIYTKQINLDGTASIKIYNQAEDIPPAPAYATKEELNSAISNLEILINSITEGKETKNESANSKGSTDAAFAF